MNDTLYCKQANVYSCLLRSISLQAVKGPVSHKSHPKFPSVQPQNNFMEITTITPLLTEIRDRLIGYGVVMLMMRLAEPRAVLFNPGLLNRAPSDIQQMYPIQNRPNGKRLQDSRARISSLMLRRIKQTTRRWKSFKRNELLGSLTGPTKRSRNSPGTRNKRGPGEGDCPRR